MVEVSDQAGHNHPIILSEGVPSIKEIQQGEEALYTFTLEDQNITRLFFQLTTIHGDPNMFVTTGSVMPTQWIFERRSSNSGFYPDLLVFEKAQGQNLTKTWNIMINSWETSTFSLSYFTNTVDNKAGVQKLMVGKKQRGILHPFSYVGGNRTNQPSLNYHFEVPRDMFVEDT